MSDTTNIFDLPTDPAAGGNINIKATENVLPNQQQQQPTNVTLDQTTISQIVNGLQQASINGATKLPSRDIPINTNNLSNDPQVQPNYIPQIQHQHQNNDYITDYENTPNIIQNYNNSYNRNNSLDEMYNEIQMPLLIALMFLLFQLPFFRKFLYSYFPILFFNDGNLNIKGFIFISILFGIFYYFLNKIVSHFAVV
jgi:DNA polymerase I-like protein with 3'-5' exonuclease and polymerase domains